MSRFNYFYRFYFNASNILFLKLLYVQLGYKPPVNFLNARGVKLSVAKNFNKLYLRGSIVKSNYLLRAGLTKKLRTNSVLFQTFFKLLFNLCYLNISILMFTHRFFKSWALSSIYSFKSSRVYDLLASNASFSFSRYGMSYDMDVLFRSLKQTQAPAVICLDDSNNVTAAYYGVRWELFTVFYTSNFKLLKWTYVFFNFNNNFLPKQHVLASLYFSIKKLSTHYFFYINRLRFLA